MLDWKKKKYPPGTEVEVMDIHQRPLGRGVMLYEYDCEDEDTPMPEIRLADGTFILGCDCWWIPVEEIKR